MQRPQIPTPDVVRQYVRKFDEGGDGIIDKSLLELFRTFPRNDRFESILLKVLGLNALYSTGILAVQPAAKHILALNIDARLANGDPELVNEIAITPIKAGKTMRFYSFATKYCSWHAPEQYPIYDSIVGGMIHEYQRLDPFTGAFWKYQLTSDYRKFKQIVDDFRRHYGLTDFSFKELDKFLWRYGKDYLGKAAQPAAGE